MKNKAFIIVIAIAIAGILVYSLMPSSSNNTLTEAPKTALSYVAQIEADRKAKDEYFKTSADSPIDSLQRPTFAGLHYFGIDSTYRVKARVNQFETSIGIPIQMTKGQEEFYKPFGTAIFDLQGTTCKLLVFKSGEEKILFIPFKDGTSSKGTYGGGRYLEIPKGMMQGDSLVIDFNRAFQPFCAYNYAYTCPIPPSENHLPIAVKAGEKK
jgi:uncharacterized protein